MTHGYGGNGPQQNNDGDDSGTIHEKENTFLTEKAKQEMSVLRNTLKYREIKSLPTKYHTPMSTAASIPSST